MRVLEAMRCCWLFRAVRCGVTGAWLWLLVAAGPATTAAAGAADDVFEVDATGTPAVTGAEVSPWHRVEVDEAHGGYWVVLGDVDGDGELEIVAARNVDQNDNHYTATVVVQELDGAVRWRWGESGAGRRELHHDVACQIHDWDHDGTLEVIVAAERQLIVLDGPTGKTVHRFAIPQHASDCVVFADLAGRGWPSEVIVKSRYEQLWAYTSAGELLWTVSTPGGYRTAHQPLPVDLDGDGRDELLAGYAALNGDGTQRWIFTADEGVRNGGHADCWRVHTLARQAGDTRLVLTMCGGNALVMTDGNGQALWKQTGHHFESVDVGKVRADVPGRQLVVDFDHLPSPPKPLCVFSERGELLGRINTDYTRHHLLIDWDGDGIDEIGSAVPRGLFDGHGRRVVTFAIQGEQRPLLIAPVNSCGRGADAVLLTTLAEDGSYFVYLYRAPQRPQDTRGAVPLGTKPNFTLY